MICQKCNKIFLRNTKTKPRKWGVRNSSRAKLCKDCWIKVRKEVGKKSKGKKRTPYFSKIYIPQAGSKSDRETKRSFTIIE